MSDPIPARGGPPALPRHAILVVAGGGPAGVDGDGAPWERRLLWRLLRHTFNAVGVAFDACARLDADTAVVVVAPPTVPADVLVDPVLAVLRHRLDAHNREAPERLRLRAAVHTGPSGAAAPDVRHALHLAAAVPTPAAFPAEDLAFVASQRLFDDVIRHGVGPADPSAYRPIPVAGHDGAAAGYGWMAPPIALPRRGRVTSAPAVHASHGGGAWTAGGRPFAEAGTSGASRVTVRTRDDDAPGGRAVLGFFGNVSFGGDAVAGDKIVYM